MDNILYASHFEGANGGEKIQKALDVTGKTPGPNTVIIEPQGPDRDGKWIINQTIRIPSDTTLILHSCYIFLADNTNDNIFRNTDIEKGNCHIDIFGIGMPRLDGNASKQDREVYGNTGPESYHYHGIHLRRVKDFSIQNIEIGPTNMYAINPNGCSKGIIRNIKLKQDGSTHNQDGVSLAGQNQEITIESISGDSGDDTIALNALNGDITDISIENIQSRVVESGNIVRLLCGNGFNLKNVRINGIMELPGSKAGSLIVFGRSKTYAQKDPTEQQFTNIYATDIRKPSGEGKRGILFASPVGYVELSNLSINGDWTDAIVQEKQGHSVGFLKINNATIIGNKKQGQVVFGFDDTIEELHLSDITIRDAEKIFRIDGIISDFHLNNVTAKS